MDDREALVHNLLINLSDSDMNNKDIKERVNLMVNLWDNHILIHPKVPVDIHWQQMKPFKMPEVKIDH